MSKDLTVNGTVFSYPSPGEEPGWGQDATEWASEVTDVLSSLVAVGDFLETTFAIGNNISSATSITGLLFNTTSVREAEVTYSLYRISDSNPSGNAERGKIGLIYDNSAAPGSKWSMTIGDIAGSAGVNFTITDTGQLQYTSTNIGSTGYSGTMHYIAKVLAQ